MRSTTRRLTRRTLEPTVIFSLVSGDLGAILLRALSVRDRLAPERPPRGWCLLRLLPGGCNAVLSGSDSGARTPPCPRCRLRRRPTGIHRWRGRPIDSRDADGRRREAACEPE